MKAWPAMAVPTTTPMRSRSSWSRSSAASLTAIFAAATAIWEVRSMRRDHFVSMNGLKSKPLSWAANWVGYGVGSNLLTRLMPDRPALSESQNASFPAPMAEMTPRPVMATRLLVGGMDGRLSLSALEWAVPLLGLEPLIDVAAAEAPVLAHLGCRDAAVLGQGVERRLGDLEVAVQLLNGQDFSLLWGQFHLVLIQNPRSFPAPQA